MSTERTIIEINGRFLVLEGDKMVASCKTLLAAERVRDQKSREVAREDAERRNADLIAAKEDDDAAEACERADRGDRPFRYIYEGTDTMGGRSVEYGIAVYADGFRCYAEW